MPIQIITKKPDTRLPPLSVGEMRYVIAENGTFLERRTGMFTTCSLVDRCRAGLASQEESCELHCPTIPAEMTASMLAFFRGAFAMHGGEAALLLLYQPLEQRFDWFCPEQSVEMWEGWNGNWYTSDRIEYTAPNQLPEGFVLFGDAHSHAAFPAGVSDVDLKDERYKDGLHIIVGRVNTADDLDFHIAFSMDGRRFRLEPADVFAVDPTSAPEVESAAEAPRDWFDRIQIDFRSYTWSNSTTAREERR